MIILITGASHTGKTLLAQRLLEERGFPYLSIDHLKMGLIRAGITHITPESDDDELTDFLWPIVSEMVKTAIENDQNLIVEGIYIPFTWADDFTSSYREHIEFRCLVMTREYITENFQAIREHGSIVEHRQDDGWLSAQVLIEQNQKMLKRCLEHGYQPTFVNY